MKWCLTTCALIVLLATVGAQTDNAWTIHAEAPISTTQPAILEEHFLTPDAKPLPPAAREGTVQWTWWSHSDATSSDWPDDDALYRANLLNLTPPEMGEVPVIERHQRWSQQTIEINGHVRIVAAEDQMRFVLFELDVTPRANLSNQTLLYVALTEDVSLDHHHRETNHLVRELRPEVGFSLSANNTTKMNAILPADHLFAAGVDLESTATGWSYTVAVFGGTEDNASSTGLLSLQHGALPSSLETLSPGERWVPFLITALAGVVIVSLLAASRSREQAIPSLKAAWTNEDGDELALTVRAGTHGFSISEWSIGEPWAFKGRPAKRRFSPHQEAIIHVKFKEPQTRDCHLHVSIDIEEMGAWRQHVWLSRKTSNEESSPQPIEEE